MLIDFLGRVRPPEDNLFRLGASRVRSKHKDAIRNPMPDDRGGQPAMFFQLLSEPAKNCEVPPGIGAGSILQFPRAVLPQMKAHLESANYIHQFRRRQIRFRENRSFQNRYAHRIAANHWRFHGFIGSIRAGFQVNPQRRHHFVLLAFSLFFGRLTAPRKHYRRKQQQIDVESTRTSHHSAHEIESVSRCKAL